MNKEHILTSLVTILLIASAGIAQEEYSQCLTPVPEELLEKLILLMGEGLSKFHGKEYSNYRLYPFYDLNGNPVAYEVMFYFGEGEAPTDEELYEISEIIYGEDLSKEEIEEFMKERGIYRTISTVNISCCYELEPIIGQLLGGMPVTFRHYAQKKKILEEDFGYSDIDISNFRGCIIIYGDSAYIKFEINGEELYLNAHGGKKIYYKNELLERVKPIEERYPEEEIIIEGKIIKRYPEGGIIIEENIVKWEEIEERFDYLGLYGTGDNTLPE